MGKEIPAGLPQIIEDYWYSIEWDVETLWALDLPVEPMPVADLLWHLDVPVWGDYQISPREVLADPAAHAAEYHRMLRADLAYPLEVARIKDRWMILDGIHRLLKAHSLGLTGIDVRKVPAEYLAPLAR